MNDLLNQEIIKEMEVRNNPYKNLINNDTFADFTNNSHLKSALGASRVSNSTDNDRFEQTKSSKKGLKLLGGTGLALAGISILSAALLHNRVGWFGEKVRTYYKNLGININKFRKNKELMSPLEKTEFCIKEKIQGVLDFALSFNQIKDRVLGKVLGPFKKQVDKIIRYFRKAAIKTTKEKYNKLLNSTGNMERNIEDLVELLSSRGLHDDAKKVDSILKQGKIQNVVKNDLVNGYENRINTLNTSLKELVDGYDDLIKGNMPKSKKIKEILQEIPDTLRGLGGIYKRLRDSVIANTRSSLSKPTENVMKSLKELDSILENIQSTNPNLSKDISKQLHKALKGVHKTSKNIDKATNFEIDNLTNRLLDLDFDGGILEVASPVLGTGLLMNEVRKGETKEEKKSKFLTLGTPIIGGLGAWYYSAIIKCMNAGTGLVFGFVTGIAFERLGKFLSNKLVNKENT